MTTTVSPELITEIEEALAEKPSEDKFGEDWCRVTRNGSRCHRKPMKRRIRAVCLVCAVKGDLRVCRRCYHDMRKHRIGHYFKSGDCLGKWHPRGWAAK